jgi:amidohydrolase
MRMQELFEVKGKTDWNSLFCNAKKISSDLVKWRRDFHRHPELGLQEVCTAEKVQDILSKHNIRCKKIGETGIVGILHGVRIKNGKTAAIRADMDAVPIQEKNKVEYRSIVPNVMHACGHDGHTACLLGAVILLSQIRKYFCGNVKFIFQPAEEQSIVGGKGGAREMVEKGVLESPKVSSIVALHLSHEYKEGDVGIRSRIINSSSTNIDLTIVGREAHPCNPEEGIDSIAIAAKIITGIQQYITRNKNILSPYLLKFTKIEGGEARNVIAAQTTIHGILRTQSRIDTDLLVRLVKDYCLSIAKSKGGKCIVKTRTLYPVQINDPAFTARIRNMSIDCLGKKRIYDILKPSMGGEDFAFYTQKIPGVYFYLGIRNKNKGFTFPLHSSGFDFDDSSILPLGAALLAKCAITLLTNKMIF